MSLHKYTKLSSKHAGYLSLAILPFVLAACCQAPSVSAVRDYHGMPYGPPGLERTAGHGPEYYCQAPRRVAYTPVYQAAPVTIIEPAAGDRVFRDAIRK